MKQATATAAMGLAFSLMLAAPASADPYGGEGGGDDSGPRGSYRATCTDIRIDGDELEARCRERDGDWRRTNLENFRDCRGDIVNEDGNLRCRRTDDDDDSGASGWTPRGSYRETCTNVRVDGDELEARCRERDGDWRQTNLDNFRNCHGDIANDDGNLRCRRGGDDDGYGRGDDDHGYGGGSGDDRRRDYGRITLYKDSNFHGRRQSFDRDVPDLHSYGFADMASSANVQGGVWQLCTRPYYRGRCVTIDDTVHNFQSLGINDRTESLRRVR